jgi:hypothetical protein
VALDHRWLVLLGHRRVPGRTPDQLPSSEAYASVVHSGGKLYMAPVTLQFWGSNANRYYEYSGFSGMRKMWMDAINVTHPDWVEIITWNDFVEGTDVSPIDDPNKYQFANFLLVPGVPLFTLNCFHSHYAATDLLQYFISGTRPASGPGSRATPSTSPSERSRQATTQAPRRWRISTALSRT